jgi:hypothetical protein
MASQHSGNGQAIAAIVAFPAKNKKMFFRPPVFSSIHRTQASAARSINSRELIGSFMIVYSSQALTCAAVRIFILVQVPLFYNIFFYTKAQTKRFPPYFLTGAKGLV